MLRDCHAMCVILTQLCGGRHELSATLCMRLKLLGGDDGKTGEALEEAQGQLQNFGIGIQLVPEN